jgi:hypothetical protein
MIQLSNTKDDFQRRLINAILKARDYASLLSRNTRQLSRDSYEVTGTSAETYFVRVLESDGEPFIFCTCDAGKHSFPCYHAAHIALVRGIIVPVGNLKFGVGRDLLATVERILAEAKPKAETVLFEVALKASQTVTVGSVVFNVAGDSVLRVVKR